MVQSASQSNPEVRPPEFWDHFNRAVERQLVGLLADALQAAARRLEATRYRNAERAEKANEVVSCISVHVRELAQGSAANSLRRAQALARRETDRPAPSELSLLADEDLEQLVAANVAIRAIGEHVSLEMAQLNTAFRAVTGVRVTGETNPIGPVTLIKGLQERLRAHDVSQSAINELLPDLASKLAPLLKDFYRQWIARCQELGVNTEPATDTPYAESRLMEAAGEAPSHRDTAAAEDHKDEEPSGKGGPEDLDRVSEKETLLSLFSLSDSTKPSENHRAFRVLTSGPMQCTRLEREDLLALVRGLQDKPLKQSSNVEERLVSVLLREAGLNPLFTDVLRDEDRAYVEITQRFFEALATESSFKRALRERLGQLRWVFLHVLLRDPNFFVNREHPLRRFLNSLGRLSFRFTSDNGLDRWLAHYVSEAVTGYDGDDALFTRLRGEVESLIQRQDDAFRRIQSRIAETAEAQKQLREARQQVGEDILERLLDREVPETIDTLLYELDWRHQLIVQWLRSAGGEGYRQSLALLENLLQRLTGHGTDVTMDDDRLKALLREEVANLKGTRARDCLKTLEAQLEGDQPVETRRFHMAHLQSREQPYHDDSEESDSDMGGEGASYLPSKHMAQLKPGDWVAFWQRDGGYRFLRLAWRGGPVFRFSGVDDLGPRDIEVHYRKLNKQLRSGRARILEESERPLVDICVHQVAHSFYEEMITEVQGDTLTGVMSRAEFERKLEHYAQRVAESGEQRYLFYVDIDRFRVINTTLGHAAGDIVLRQVAQKLRRWVSEPLLVGRLGGNEFGVIVHTTSSRLAVSLADGWRAKIAREEFAFQDELIPITVSIGIDRLGSDQEGGDRALRQAALACMAAKEEGGNNVNYYQADSEEQARHSTQMNWLSRMDRGLDDLLELRCQPIVSLTDPDEAPHYEVLLGVRAPDGSIMPPAALIEAAEQHKRMKQVDCWVINAVFEWMETHPAKMADTSGFSINLSGSSITDDSVLEYILAQLTRRKLDTRKVCFEITETSAISSLSTANEFISEIKRFGCKFSLDDFGTGLSSYAYLQKLDVDHLKIDGIFIRNIVHSTKDQALVCSIVELAQFMGLKTIAEFVEDVEGRDYLKALGVDKGQGYYLGKPRLMKEL